MNRGNVNISVNVLTIMGDNMTWVWCEVVWSGVMRREDLI